jgi:hypothetical protein
MTRLSAPPRHTRRRGLRRTVASFAATIGLAVAVLGSVLVPAGAASASLGSVPAEVTAYVSSGAMVGRLNDVYGPNASGTKGIKFDDTTKAGPISRVYEWTAERLANHATDHPVQLTNNWVVPITIGGKSVGLATIWINPQTVDAELASFDPSAGLGSALTTVPATAALVHDSTTGAWLALADGKVTALVAGTSGITGSVPVSSLKLSPTAPAPIATTEPNTGLALAIGIVALIVIIIVVALLLPRGRRAKTKSQDSGSQDAAAAPIADEKVAEPEPAPEPAAAPAPAAATATAAASPSKPAARKPAGARPSGRTPTTSTAAKPATSKPPVSRPAASKPPATKPPAPKQPPRPRAPKPPAESTGSDS